MDMLHHDILHRRQVVLQLVGTFNYCRTVPLPRSHGGNSGYETRAFNLSMGPCPRLPANRIEYKNH